MFPKMARKKFMCHIALFLNDGFNCTSRQIQELGNVLVSIPQPVELLGVLLCLYDVVFVQDTESPVTGPSRYSCIYTAISETHSLQSEICI